MNTFIHATYATKATATRGAKRLNARYSEDGSANLSAAVVELDGSFLVEVTDTAPIATPELELDFADDHDEYPGSVIVSGTVIAADDHDTDGVNVCPLCQTVDHNRTWYTEGVTMQCHDCGRVYSATTGKEVVIKTTVRTNKSTVESPTKLVWRIADSMPGARRKDIIAACEAAGVAYYTARTQYQHYTTAVKEQAKNQTKTK